MLRYLELIAVGAVIGMTIVAIAAIVKLALC